jgi:hypothetical protein
VATPDAVGEFSVRYSFKEETKLLAVEVSPEVTALCSDWSRSEKLSVPLVLELPVVAEEVDEDAESEPVGTCFIISASTLLAVVVSPDCRAALRLVRACCIGFEEAVAAPVLPLGVEGGALFVR